MVDRRHLNTLYVSTEGAYLRKDGENAVVEVEDAERLRVPLAQARFHRAVWSCRRLDGFDESRHGSRHRHHALR